MRRFKTVLTAITLIASACLIGSCKPQATVEGLKLKAQALSQDNPNYSCHVDEQEKVFVYTYQVPFDINWDDTKQRFAESGLFDWEDRDTGPFLKYLEDLGYDILFEFYCGESLLQTYRYNIRTRTLE